MSLCKPPHTPSSTPRIHSFSTPRIHSFSTAIRRLSPVFCCFLLVFLVGCGYTWRGEQGSIATQSIIENNTKTLKIQAIEQPTLYPWLSYFVRSVLRDEITQRNIATWVDSGSADYEMLVTIKDFQIRSYGSYAYSSLLTARTNMELTLYDGKTNAIIWQSGPITYSETYEDVNEDVALKELVIIIVQRSIDRLQQQF